MGPFLVTIPPPQRKVDLKLSFSVLENYECNLQILVSGPFLDALQHISLINQEKWPMSLSAYMEWREINGDEFLREKDIHLTNVENPNGELCFEGNNKLVIMLNNLTRIQLGVTLMLDISNLIALGQRVNPAAFRCWEILNEYEGDFTLVAGDDTRIPCLRSNLRKMAAACGSEKLQTMSGNLTPGNVLHLRDMTGEGLHALLEYLYCGMTCRAEYSSGVCVQLFRASLQYGIPVLREKVKDILLQREIGWFDIDSVLALFRLVRNVSIDASNQLAELKKKVAEIFCSYEDIETSQFFQDLRRDEPALATELLILAVKFYRRQIRVD